MPTLDTTNIDKKVAIGILWQQGIVHFKLDAVQKELYNSYVNATHKTIVWSCSRRLGKSYALCVIAIETCLRKPNSVVKYLAPSQKHVKMIIKPLIKEILKDCPKGIRPNFMTMDNVYRFPNGSEIQLAGTDSGHAENLRGGGANLCIVDEAGFCDDLKYIIQSILIPTTTTTRGKIILSSTPPKSPDHDFTYYMKTAAFKGSFVKKTIYDGLGSRITQEIIDEIIEELGGADSSDFRREYMCEVITSEEHSVVPEFNEDLQKRIIKEWPRPAFFDIYVAGDIGFRDLTVFLYGYYDFKAAKVIIEDEVVMNGKRMTTDALAKALKAKETELYTSKLTGETQAPYLRVCDNNLIVINDLHSLHKLTFLPTAKDDSEAAINNMRIMLKSERVIIHPRCKTLIYHLANATWNKSRKSYEHGPDGSHYDACDALKYFIRNVQLSKNPYPASWAGGSRDQWYIPEKKGPQTPIQTAIAKMFQVKKFR